MAKRRQTRADSPGGAGTQRRYSFSYADVRERLVEVHGPGAVSKGPDYVKAPCVHPDHDDENPSMSVSEAEDGRVLVKCHAGCDQQELFSALRAFMGDAVDRPSGEQGDLNPQRECTLAAYAEAKRLPQPFLEGLGLRDQTLPNQGRVVRIPYSDDAIRYRTAVSGSSRFRWKSGSKPGLYGLFRLDEMTDADYVLLVEGESCAQTAWLHDVPALGLPGAAGWQDERDVPHLDGFGRIYVLIEPDRGGEAVLRWVEKSSIRDRVELVTLDGYEDLSELHIADPERFVEQFNSALEAAKPWGAFDGERRKLVQAEAWERCARLANEEHILDRFRDEIRAAGVVGEEDTACLLYLAVTSRAFERPVSVLVKGPSSAGKSFVVEQVVGFFPSSAYYSLSAMSERALVYWDEDLCHRTLVLYEAEALQSDFLSYLLRSLLSEGQIRYVTVEATPDGIQPREIVRPGPTGLILTTTRIAIHPENETRMLSLTIADTPEQTREVMLAIARGSAGGDMAEWHALQDWLSASETPEVLVPFAERLAEEIPPVATRLRRDFTTILTLIRAHALLHQENREWDDRGRLLASLDDYSVVRDLIADVLAEGVGVAVSDEIAEVVEAVEQLLAEEDAGETAGERGNRLRVDFSPGVSTSRVARYLGLDETTAWRRVQAALQGNYLKNLETRKYVKARLMPGDVPLDERAVLPRVEDLR